MTTCLLPCPCLHLDLSIVHDERQVQLLTPDRRLRTGSPASGPCLTAQNGLHRAQPLLQSLEQGTRQTPTGYRAIKSQRSMAGASTDGEEARASSQPPVAAAQQQQLPAQALQQPAPMLQQAPRARKRSATMAAAEAVAAEAPASKRSKPAAR